MRHQQITAAWKYRNTHTKRWHRACFQSFKDILKRKKANRHLMNGSQNNRMEGSRPTSKPQKWRGGVEDHFAIFICFSIRCAKAYARTGCSILSLRSISRVTALCFSANQRKKRTSPRQRRIGGSSHLFLMAEREGFEPSVGY